MFLVLSRYGLVCKCRMDFLVFLILHFLIFKIKLQQITCQPAVTSQMVCHMMR